MVPQHVAADLLTTMADALLPLVLCAQAEYQPMVTALIANWVKQTMTLAGIDTEKFKTHSCRTATTSKAKAQGLSIAQILSTAKWSNATTFKRFYDREIDEHIQFQHSIMRSHIYT